MCPGTGGPRPWGECMLPDGDLHTDLVSACGVGGVCKSALLPGFLSAA